MNLVFVGWNHRCAPLDLRERLSFTPERALEALEGLFREKILSEGAIISTCNRAEVYGLSEHEDSLDALSTFFSRFHAVDSEVLRKSSLSGYGDATVRHLFRVSAGLDSMVLGEAQILGQVREAHRVAVAARTTRAVTNKLFQSAVECGRRVRTETTLGTRPTSVPGIALLLAGRIFESLRGRRVLLLGAGEVIELTARLLVDEGVTDLVFCNRSLENAEALAKVSAGRVIPWDRRITALAEVDVVLSATGAPEPILRASEVRSVLSRNRRGPLLMLDLAVPRDIEPGVDDIADVYRYDVDALAGIAQKNSADRLAEVPRADEIVEQAVQKFSEWFSGLLQMDVVRMLRTKLESVRRQELERYHGKLSRSSAEERELVDRITESLVAKILHEPTIGLKQGDVSERIERAAAVRVLFKLDEPESMVCLPLAITPSIGANSSGHCANWPSSPL
ncbi:MAG: glutamyl-tRNA reductase [Thermoanaerobaculia bacterium]